MEPAIRYARSGEASIAYQVFGDGPNDLLLVVGWISQIDQLWEMPASRRLMERLGEFSRLISFDPRGTGFSDDLGTEHTPEQDAADALAVLDAAGSERATVYTKWLGGPSGAVLAAEHPDRVAALVMYASVARASWAPDYDWAMTDEQREALIESNVGEWGAASSRELARWAPSMADDPALAAWFARYQRSVAPPGEVRSRMQAAGRLDVRERLPQIRAPALVLHRSGDRIWDIRHSRYLADHIPDARLVELDGDDSIDFLGDWGAIADEVEEFLTGVRTGGGGSRALLTVMFTDIVDSTARAAELGDRRWRDLLAEHDAVVRKELSRFGGREVKTTGDGFLATFSGPPSSALRCAEAVTAATRDLGVEVRVGIHTGECELIDGDIGGMAVHVAARIGGIAREGEVLVSPAVAGAVVGGPFVFEDRGTHELKGVPGSWPLSALQG
jgi:class 3 adenylate cyclase